MRAWLLCVGFTDEQINKQGIKERIDMYNRARHINGTLDYYAEEKERAKKGQRITTETSKGQKVRTSVRDFDYMQKIMGGKV